MSPEAQRIVIAKAVGWSVKWKAQDPFKYLCRPGEELGICCGLHLSDEQIFNDFLVLGECGPSYVIPDYLNDLNACHEMEKSLTDDQWWIYSGALVHMCNEIPVTDVLHATAAQRSEAFLRTIGKWEARASVDVKTKEDAHE